MFSGKTTELLRRIEQYPPEAVLAVKHPIDTRYSAEKIVSHGGQARFAQVVAEAHEIASRTPAGTRLLAIDEGHFFGEALVGAVSAATAEGIDVLVTALDRDSWGHPFPVAARLVELADEPVIKDAVCARCQARADRTQRLTPIVNGNLVGGPESYEPRCQNCWSPPPESPPD